MEKRREIVGQISGTANRRNRRTPLVPLGVLAAQCARYTRGNHRGSVSRKVRPVLPTPYTIAQSNPPSSRPEDSHLRALPDPYVNLSIHTAPDVRPFP